VRHRAWGWGAAGAGAEGARRASAPRAQGRTGAGRAGPGAGRAGPAVPCQPAPASRPRPLVLGGWRGGGRRARAPLRGGTHLPARLQLQVWRHSSLPRPPAGPAAADGAVQLGGAGPRVPPAERTQQLRACAEPPTSAHTRAAARDARMLRSAPPLWASVLCRESCTMCNAWCAGQRRQAARAGPGGAPTAAPCMPPAAAPPRHWGGGGALGESRGADSGACLFCARVAVLAGRRTRRRSRERGGTCGRARARVAPTRAPRALSSAPSLPLAS
jgi:hypothetical protein